MTTTSKTPFVIGQRVRFLTDVDLQPHTTVRAGEAGVIVAISLDFVDILLDVFHKGLCEYENVAWLCPTYDTLERCIEVIRCAA